VKRYLVSAVVFSAALASACASKSSSKGGDGGIAAAEAGPPKREWQILASELPSALLSVSGRSDTDIFAVGSDKGKGPLVLHFDGAHWKELKTGQSADLWWVQAQEKGPVLMGGASGTVLRYDGQKFERMQTPGLGKHTVYGVWGTSGEDFYAVGSAGGRNGFVWHYHDKKFENEVIPLDVPRLPSGEVSGFFKVIGQKDQVWVVGAAGAILRRTGNEPFAVVPSNTKETLFTVHATGDRVDIVGGSSNGVLLDGTKGVFKDASPKAAGLIQGIFTSDAADWASGERGFVYTREKGAGPFNVVDHGLVMPAAFSLHSIFVDSKGGVWSAGGNVLTPTLNNGMLIHYGEKVPPVVIDDERLGDGGVADAASGDAGTAAAECPSAALIAGKSGSVARRWDEQALAAIRLDLPRPTVHARNLFHMSAAMWDAWAAYDMNAKGVFVSERRKAQDWDRSRRVAVSYAAYGILSHRYKKAVGGPTTVACLRATMKDLGLDPDDSHDQEPPSTANPGDDPIAFGNRVAHTIIEKFKDDGANEANDYADTTGFTTVNPPLVYDNAGAPLKDPEHWQQLNLSMAATQNGIILPAGVQSYIGAQWGSVPPFAMKRASDKVAWKDAGPAPKLGPDMKKWVTEVIKKTASLDPADPATIDISPAVFGHNPLGTNDGKGYGKNPVSGKPYAPNVVPLGDFARVMAEFWADGPKSETPPGHWNVMANMVADSPDFKRQLFGKGEPLDRLAWDVHVYLALNGALHDAAIAAWDQKRRTMTARPISLIRYMGEKGQSTDKKDPSYNAEGLPLVPGLIEVITKESSAPGERHAHLAFFVGQIAVKNWLGEPGDRQNQVGGVGWVRAVDWITYQRRTFVTPAFPAFISGHSTFSRAGAEVLTGLTGSEYFPGGLGEHVAPKDTFLTFEKGPTKDVRLQWATFYDAADQAGQSRLWGSIHIAPDDFAGRKVGHQIGLDAVTLARTYYR
jgi:hypothetical protein